MTAFRWPQAAILLTLLTVSALPVAADSVQLANGDVLNGRALGLDDTQLRLESATLGQEAIRARDELKKATKGLGPDVEGAMAPYLSILEKFIGETQPPPAPAKPRQKTEPPANK